MPSSTGGGNWACHITTQNSNVGHPVKISSLAPCPMRKPPPSSPVPRMPLKLSGINWVLSHSPQSDEGPSRIAGREARRDPPSGRTKDEETVWLAERIRVGARGSANYGIWAQYIGAGAELITAA